MWWDNFFVNQYKIIKYFLANHWLVTSPFTPFLGLKSHALCSNSFRDEIAKLIHLRQGDNYIGPRMSNEVEARWCGNLQDIEVCTLIATLADSDKLGHPFWIAKVLELIKDEGNNKLL